ncbi:hypothetical protein [Larkinella punicea]|uniref:Nucleotide-diphospho-sugar transferase domain-containing protein n=1 Tax=Larkinella punicea TaxID=2315727 RepID=A0A368JJ01_9BACT|nr:hypothetical protein [Larkinella punicea]RCR67628.1 hypothetical protein DUE52_21230 [Larkinella punicea]
MIKKILISYSNKKYSISQKRLLKSAKRKYGITNHIKYNEKWLKKKKFYNENTFILSQSRGAGYMIWKPFIILETLNKVSPLDYIIYADSDMVFMKSIEPLFKICSDNNGLMIFDNSTHKNSTWTKRDCFILMDADKEEYYDNYQCMSGFIVLQKRDWVIHLMTEWLEYARDYRNSTDSENELGYPNLLDFIEHRHDQSILSILYKKYNLPLFRDPTQYGNQYKLLEYRVEGEFLISNRYENQNLIKKNSPYDTLLEIMDVPLHGNNLISFLKKNVKKILRILKTN